MGFAAGGVRAERVVNPGLFGDAVRGGVVLLPGREGDDGGAVVETAERVLRWCRGRGIGRSRGWRSRSRGWRRRR